MTAVFRENVYNNPSIKYFRGGNINNEIYKVYVGGLIWGTAVLDKEGSVYIGSTNKRFFKLDRYGHIKWVYKLKNVADSLVDSAAAIHPDGFVVIPGGDGYLHAVDMYTGKIKWIKENSEVTKNQHNNGVIVNSFEGNVQIDENGIIYAGCDNDYFYCINPLDGSTKWSFKTNMMIWTCAIISNGLCYFGSLDYYLYVLTKNGKLVKKEYLGSEIKSSPLFHNKCILIGTTNGDVYCFAEGLEHLIWKVNIGRNIYASPIIYKGCIIYCELNGDIFALNLNDGSTIWKRTLYNNFLCSSPIIINNGDEYGNIDVLYVATSLGKLFAIDPNTGNIISTISLIKGKKKAINASLCVNDSGQIIFGSYDGFIYFVPCTFYKKYISEITKQPSYIYDIYKPHTHLRVITDNCNIITLRLFVIEDGILNNDISISYNSVKLDKNIPYDIFISADGYFINLIPKSMDHVNKKFTINVSGKYYIQTNSWINDRFAFGEKRFEDTVTFTGPISKTHHSVNIPKEIDVNNFYICQPLVLDTYIPAAMDSQGFKMYISNIKDGLNKKTCKIVILAAIPDIEDEFQINEDAKKFILDGEIYNNIIIINGNFEYSAMGGTIPCKNFKAFLTINDNFVNGEFIGIANCLGIKGNGKSYKFSYEIINQICDIYMQVHNIGTCSGIIKSYHKNYLI